jgi:predicted transcriptional regulator
MKTKKGKSENVGVDSKINDQIFDKLMKSKIAQEAYYEEKAMFHYIESLKKEMTKKHLTYYAVAKKAGINHQVVAQILNGADNAKLSTLTKVAYGAGGKLELNLVFGK